MPVKVFGDLRAQLAACTIAERAFADLVRGYGAERTRFYMRELTDYAERLDPRRHRRPAGRRVELHRPHRRRRRRRRPPDPLKVTIRKRGDGMVVDWTGSSPQVKGAINNTFSYTRSASYCGIRSVLPANIPNNEGYFRAIEVVAPPGTIANAVLPAACAARGLTGFRMVDCMFGALAMMLPDRVCAAGDGGNTGVSIGGYDRERRPFIYVDFTCSAWGGRPFADGPDGNSHMFANMASQPIEVTEAEHPIQILVLRLPARHHGSRQAPRRRALLPRVPFPGGRRRAAGALRPPRLPPLRPLRRRAGPTLQQHADPRRADGNAALEILLELRRGDVFRHEVAGGGGWGDPLERDPALVLRDVRNGMVSLASARDDYGVVLDAAAGPWTPRADAALRAPRWPRAAPAAGREARARRAGAERG